MLVGQVLPVDSIVDGGGWMDPGNIMASDDLYATTGAQNDNLILRIANPADTTGTLDSVYVYLEQYVSAANGFWNVTPVINGVPGTQTADVAGTLADSTLGFNITADITGWADLFDFQIDLSNAKGGGATPDWFADHLYAYVFVGGADVGEETGQPITTFTLSAPSLSRSTLRFAYSLDADAPVTVEIFNVSGARVLQTQLAGKTGSNRAVLNIGNYGHGVYFLKATAPSGTRTAKFMVLN
jgi:hypothetical protein